MFLIYVLGNNERKITAVKIERILQLQGSKLQGSKSFSWLSVKDLAGMESLSFYNDTPSHLFSELAVSTQLPRCVRNGGIGLANCV